MGLSVRSEAGVVIVDGTMLTPNAARALANDLLVAAQKAQVHLSRNSMGMPEKVSLEEMKNQGPKLRQAPCVGDTGGDW